MPGGGALAGNATLTGQQRKILDYATANSGSARIKLAVEGGATATSTFILASDAVIIGMGGFLGSDDAPSVQQLQTWTTSGQLRYVLGGGSGRGPAMAGGGGAAADRTKWVEGHCVEVPSSAYGGEADSGSTGAAAFGFGGTTLYDCAPKP